MLEEDEGRLFLHGACHVFALALHESFNYPIVLLQDTTAEQSKSATHVYCRFSNWQSVDVVGIAREEDALAELGWIGAKYRPRKVSPSELENYFTLTEGGGLYAAAVFLSVARAR